MQYTAANMQFVPSQRAHRDNSAQLPSLRGTPLISWDQDLNFTTADSSIALLDTSLPLASTSSFSALVTPDNTFFDTTNWHSLSLPSGNEQFARNALHHSLAPGGSPLLMTTEEHINLLAMAPNMHTTFDMSMTTPMEPNRSQSGSSSTSFQNQNSYSPEHSPPTRLSTSTKSSPPTEPPTKIEKRKANTLAARRYRQKRVDQVSGLEAELKQAKAESDEWKVRCAKLEGEVEALRALIRSQK
ncbi:hypothetical protein C7974DRAFT_418993 [Boeremia exigua]|uniref:uncharacterized protein n=1 Tax=Boeremia exigua TaxID=749465 RepID=UPI001E8E5A8A|nr:uncharacterized protein C7974DRAFT_418993 [Boeremia exigua]KAH6612092.1 hypothetical protein C7974DRAFT_418993 [Boeremia exigua]